MSLLAGIAGGVLVAVVLWDAFETIVLPRRVTRRVRLTRFFYRATWRPFAASARFVHAGGRREAYLGFYGPLSLLLLLVLWAAALVLGFGLLQYAAAPGSFTTDVYMSGTTFFTLGLGDVAPRGTFARVLPVVESGLGFGFLAIVIGYFPVLYQAFSRREVSISLLDARAGSPPSAAELLRRHAGPGGAAALEQLLRDWERWAAEVLETHLSYPLLAYFRSQHTNQSWLAALTTVLDTSALVMVGVEGACARQARLTFAMARHGLGPAERAATGGALLRRRLLPIAVALAGAALSTAAAAAQQTGAPDTSGATIRATAILTAVTLDGRPGEPFWASADSIDAFRQREPREGASASERTVVKVVYDAAALYILVRCEDGDRRGVRASQLRRDADLSSDDNVRLLIDTFDDRRSGFVFGTNPNGAMWDAQFSGVDDLNQNWNGIWDVAVSRDAAGWTAEFRIPLLALRFPSGANTTFGFNVRRFIRRKNEEDLWRSYGRAQGLYQLNNEGSITGLEHLHRPRALELYPYALGRVVETAHDSVGGERARGFFGGKGGIDA